MLRGYQISHLDSPDLRELMGDVIAVRTAAYFEWNGPRTPDEEREQAEAWLRRISERRDPAAFVARHGDQIIAYLWGHSRDDAEFHISHIGVHPEHQRRGIGRALLRECEAACLSRGYRALTTSTYNRFRGMLVLLLQEGFDIQGVTWTDGARELRVLLRKPLTQ